MRIHKAPFIAGLSLSVAILLLLGGCSGRDKLDNVIDQAVDEYIFDGHYKASNNLVIEVDGDQAVITSFGTHPLGKNSSVINVGDPYIKNIEKVAVNKYEGDIIQRSNDNTGKLSSVSYIHTEISVTESGFSTDPYDSPDFGFTKTTDPGNGGGGNNTGTAGIWKRIESPKGYETDLAVGGIPGEPANRVYMCEHPGSPSAGLYKGTISGETITWDAVHGLPTARFYEKDGFMRLWFSVAPESEAGKYVKSVWTNTCGPLENSVKKIAVGFNKSECIDVNLNMISIKIENVNCPITQLSASVPVPECTSGKFITAPSSTANPDYYMVSITYSSLDLNSQPYTKTEQTIIYKSSLINGCNKFKLDNSATNRWVLLQL